MLDDLTVVQQKDNGILCQKPSRVPGEYAYRYDGFQNLNAKNAGMNPPNGAVINYYLKNMTDSTR